MDMPPQPGLPPLSGLRPHFPPFLRVFLFFSSFLLFSPSFSFLFFFFSFLFFFFSFLSSSLGEHEITATFLFKRLDLFSFSADLCGGEFFFKKNLHKIKHFVYVSHVI